MAKPARLLVEHNGTAIYLVSRGGNEFQVYWYAISKVGAVKECHTDQFDIRTLPTWDRAVPRAESMAAMRERHRDMIVAAIDAGADLKTFTIGAQT